MAKRQMRKETNAQRHKMEQQIKLLLFSVLYSFVTLKKLVYNLLEIASINVSTVSSNNFLCFSSFIPFFVELWVGLSLTTNARILFGQRNVSLIMVMFVERDDKCNQINYIYLGLSLNNLYLGLATGKNINPGHK